MCSQRGAQGSVKGKHSVQTVNQAEFLGFRHKFAGSTSNKCLSINLCELTD